MKKAPTEKQKAKMAQILMAAEACFAEKGFHQTSTAEICQAAGMSPGNLFHYFPSKMAMIEAIAEEDGQLFDGLFSEHTDEQNIVASIVNIVLAIIAYLNTNETYAKIGMEVAAEAVRNREVMQIFLATEAANQAKLAQLLALGIAQGSIDADLEPTTTAWWLLTLANGTLGHSVMAPDFDWASHRQVLSKMIHKALRP